jgi:hypothetical protein
MNRISASFAPLAVLALPVWVACSQPPVLCTASASEAYAARYTRVAGDEGCSVGALPGDTIGFAAFNAPSADGSVPDLENVSLAVRTRFLGSQVAYGVDMGVVDETVGHRPHAFGPFASAVPQNDICTANPSPAEQVLAAIEGDIGDPEDPDDDVFAQPAIHLKEEWSDLQVYVTAANLGTQVKGRYKVTDVLAECTAEYDVLAVFPAVHCEDIATGGDPLDIDSIDDDGPGGRVRITTVAAHGLAVGDIIDISDVDDAELSFDGTYTVGVVVSPTEIITREIDPFDGDEPDPRGTSGTLQRLQRVPNDDYCVAFPQPEKGLPLGSGISQDYPVVCDPQLFLCVLDAEPSGAALPVLVQ